MPPRRGRIVLIGIGLTTLGVALACAAAGCSSGEGSSLDASAGDSAGDGGGSADGTASDGMTGSDAGNDGSAAITSECVTKINAYRTQVAAPPVTSKSTQVACAEDQAMKGALDLADSGVTTFHKYFGQCSEAYQNECWYSVDDPSAVIDWCLDAFWQEGPPDTGINHYSVMTDTNSTAVACGLFHMPGGGYWMTNDYY